jgi:heme oxygenase
LSSFIPSTAAPTPTRGSSGLLGQLRDGTRAAHDEIEATFGLLDPMLTTVRYGVILAQFRSVYSPLETQLAGFDWECHGLELEGRRKVPLIDADLCVLGCSEPAQIPSAPFVPDLERNLARAFGCLYVLEGATLGGQVISRHIRATLGILPGTGGAFFHGYGERTGLMWTQFRTAIEGFAAHGPDADCAVATARETFDAIRQAVARNAT